MTQKALSTHCKNGHEFTPENTRMKNRGNGKFNRECRTCNTERVRTKRDYVRQSNRAKNEPKPTPSNRKSTSEIIRSGVFGKDCMTLAEYRLYRDVK